MSKLATMITATQTGNKRAVQNTKYLSVDMNSQAIQGYHAEYQVRLSVNLTKDAFISDDMKASNTDIWKESLYHMRRAMIEEVFGEFRPLIIEARTAVYEKDFDRLRLLLAELENQMFVDGL
jgi:hypothetical protein